MKVLQAFFRQFAFEKRTIPSFVRGSLQKSVAIVTAGSFLLTGVCGQAIAALSQAKQEQDRFNQVFSDYVIPATRGRITAANYSGSSTVVINIQDLHCHPEVQKNISAILCSLAANYRLSRIYLEGASGTVDLRCFTAIPDPRLKDKVLGSLLRKGELTGVEYFAAGAGAGIPILGLEDEALYQENSLRLGRIKDSQPAIEELLKRMRARLGQVKKEYYNPKQQNIEETVEKYRAGKLEARKYYALLIKHAKSRGIDVNGYPGLTAFLTLLELEKSLNYRRISVQMSRFIADLKSALPYAVYNSILQQSDNFTRQDELYRLLAKMTVAYNLDIARRYPALSAFFDYVNASQRMDPLSLLREEHRLVEEIQLSLAGDRSEREVVFLMDNFRYLEDYVRGRISADDYAEFARDLDEFKVLYECYADDTAMNEMGRFFSLLKEYYGANIERNRCFIRNMLGERAAQTVPSGRPLPADGENIVRTVESLGTANEIIVVVAGGFHTQGIGRLLDERGISHLDITPNVTENTAFADAVYWEKLREQNMISGQAFAVRALVKQPVDKFSSLTAGAMLSALVSQGMRTREIEAEIQNYFDRWKNSGEPGPKIKFSLLPQTGKNELRFELLFNGGNLHRYAYNLKTDTITILTPDGRTIVHSGDRKLLFRLRALGWLKALLPLAVVSAAVATLAHIIFPALPVVHAVAAGIGGGMLPFIGDDPGEKGGKGDRKQYTREEMMEFVRGHYPGLSGREVVTVFGEENGKSAEEQMAEHEQVLTEQSEAGIHAIGMSLWRLPRGKDIDTYAKEQGLRSIEEYYNHGKESKTLEKPKFNIDFMNSNLGIFVLVKEIPVTDERSTLMFYLVEDAGRPSEQLAGTEEKIRDGQALAEAVRRTVVMLRHRRPQKKKRTIPSLLGMKDRYFDPALMIFIGSKAAFATDTYRAFGKYYPKKFSIANVLKIAIVPDDFWIHRTVREKLKFLAGSGEWTRASAMLERFSPSRKRIADIGPTPAVPAVPAQENAQEKNTLPAKVTREFLRKYDATLSGEWVISVFGKNTKKETREEEIRAQAAAGIQPLGFTVSTPEEIKDYEDLDMTLDLKVRSKPVKLKLFAEKIKGDDGSIQGVILHFVDAGNMVYRGEKQAEWDEETWNFIIDAQVLALASRSFILSLTKKKSLKLRLALNDKDINIRKASPALIKLIGPGAALLANPTEGARYRLIDKLNEVSERFDVVATTDDENWEIPRLMAQKVCLREYSNIQGDVKLNEFAAKYANKILPGETRKQPDYHSSAWLGMKIRDGDAASIKFATSIVARVHSAVANTGGMSAAEAVEGGRREIYEFLADGRGAAGTASEEAAQRPSVMLFGEVYDEPAESLSGAERAELKQQWTVEKEAAEEAELARQLAAGEHPIGFTVRTIPDDANLVEYAKTHQLEFLSTLKISRSLKSLYGAADVDPHAAGDEVGEGNPIAALARSLIKDGDARDAGTLAAVFNKMLASDLHTIVPAEKLDLNPDAVASLARLRRAAELKLSRSETAADRRAVNRAILQKYFPGTLAKSDITIGRGQGSYNVLFRKIRGADGRNALMFYVIAREKTGYDGFPADDDREALKDLVDGQGLAAVARTVLQEIRNKNLAVFNENIRAIMGGGVSASFVPKIVRLAGPQAVFGADIKTIYGVHGNVVTVAALADTMKITRGSFEAVIGATLPAEQVPASYFLSSVADENKLIVTPEAYRAPVKKGVKSGKVLSILLIAAFLGGITSSGKEEEKQSDAAPGLTPALLSALLQAKDAAEHLAGKLRTQIVMYYAHGRETAEEFLLRQYRQLQGEPLVTVWGHDSDKPFEDLKEELRAAARMQGEEGVPSIGIRHVLLKKDENIADFARSNGLKTMKQYTRRKGARYEYKKEDIDPEAAQKEIPVDSVLGQFILMGLKDLSAINAHQLEVLALSDKPIVDIAGFERKSLTPENLVPVLNKMIEIPLLRAYAELGRRQQPAVEETSPVTDSWQKIADIKAENMAFLLKMLPGTLAKSETNDIVVNAGGRDIGLQVLVDEFTLTEKAAAKGRHHAAVIYLVEREGQGLREDMPEGVSPEIWQKTVDARVFSPGAEQVLLLLRKRIPEFSNMFAALLGLEDLNPERILLVGARSAFVDMKQAYGGPKLRSSLTRKKVNKIKYIALMQDDFLIPQKARIKLKFSMGNGLDDQVEASRALPVMDNDDRMIIAVKGNAPGNDEAGRNSALAVLSLALPVAALFAAVAAIAHVYDAFSVTHAVSLLAGGIALKTLLPQYAVPFLGVAATAPLVTRPWKIRTFGSGEEAGGEEPVTAKHAAKSDDVREERIYELPEHPEQMHKDAPGEPFLTLFGAVYREPEGTISDDERESLRQQWEEKKDKEQREMIARQLDEGGYHIGVAIRRLPAGVDAVDFAGPHNYELFSRLQLNNSPNFRYTAADINMTEAGNELNVDEPLAALVRSRITGQGEPTAETIADAFNRLLSTKLYNAAGTGDMNFPPEAQAALERLKEKDHRWESTRALSAAKRAVNRDILHRSFPRTLLKQDFNADIDGETVGLNVLVETVRGKDGRNGLIFHIVEPAGVSYRGMPGNGDNRALNDYIDGRIFVAFVNMFTAAIENGNLPVLRKNIIALLGIRSTSFNLENLNMAGTVAEFAAQIHFALNSFFNRIFMNGAPHVSIRSAMQNMAAAEEIMRFLPEAESRTAWERIMTFLEKGGKDIESTVSRHKQLSLTVFGKPYREPDGEFTAEQRTELKRQWKEEQFEEQRKALQRQLQRGYQPVGITFMKGIEGEDLLAYARERGLSFLSDLNIQHSKSFTYKASDINYEVAEKELGYKNRITELVNEEIRTHDAKGVASAFNELMTGDLYRYVEIDALGLNPDATAAFERLTADDTENRKVDDVNTDKRTVDRAILRKYFPETLARPDITITYKKNKIDLPVLVETVDGRDEAGEERKALRFIIVIPDEGPYREYPDINDRETVNNVVDGQLFDQANRTLLSTIRDRDHSVLANNINSILGIRGAAFKPGRINLVGSTAAFAAGIRKVFGTFSRIDLFAVMVDDLAIPGNIFEALTGISMASGEQVSSAYFLSGLDENARLVLPGAVGQYPAVRTGAQKPAQKQTVGSGPAAENRKTPAFRKITRADVNKLNRYLVGKLSVSVYGRGIDSKAREEIAEQVRSGGYPLAFTFSSAQNFQKEQTNNRQLQQVKKYDITVRFRGEDVHLEVWRETIGLPGIEGQGLILHFVDAGNRLNRDGRPADADITLWNDVIDMQVLALAVRKMMLRLTADTKQTVQEYFFTSLMRMPEDRDREAALIRLMDDKAAGLADILELTYKSDKKSTMNKVSERYRMVAVTDYDLEIPVSITKTLQMGAGDYEKGFLNLGAYVSGLMERRPVHLQAASLAADSRAGGSNSGAAEKQGRYLPFVVTFLAVAAALYSFFASAAPGIDVLHLMSDGIFFGITMKGSSRGSNRKNAKGREGEDGQDTGAGPAAGDVQSPDISNDNGKQVTVTGENGESREKSLEEGRAAKRAALNKVDLSFIGKRVFNVYGHFDKEALKELEHQADLGVLPAGMTLVRLKPDEKLSKYVRDNGLTEVQEQRYRFRYRKAWIELPIYVKVFETGKKKRFPVFFVIDETGRDDAASDKIDRSGNPLAMQKEGRDNIWNTIIDLLLLSSAAYTMIRMFTVGKVKNLNAQLARQNIFFGFQLGKPALVKLHDVESQWAMNIELIDRDNKRFDSHIPFMTTGDDMEIDNDIVNTLDIQPYSVRKFVDRNENKVDPADFILLQSESSMERLASVIRDLPELLRGSSVRERLQRLSFEHKAVLFDNVRWQTSGSDGKKGAGSGDEGKAIQERGDAGQDKNAESARSSGARNIASERTAAAKAKPSIKKPLPETAEIKLRKRVKKKREKTAGKSARGAQTGGEREQGAENQEQLQQGIYARLVQASVKINDSLQLMKERRAVTRESMDAFLKRHYKELNGEVLVTFLGEDSGLSLLKQWKADRDTLVRQAKRGLYPVGIKYFKAARRMNILDLAEKRHLLPLSHFLADRAADYRREEVKLRVAKRELRNGSLISQFILQAIGHGELLTEERLKEIADATAAAKGPVIPVDEAALASLSQEELTDILNRILAMPRLYRYIDGIDTWQPGPLVKDALEDVKDRGENAGRNIKLLNRAILLKMLPDTLWHNDITVPILGRKVGLRVLVEVIPVGENKNAVMFYLVEPPLYKYRNGVVRNELQKVWEKALEGYILARGGTQLMLYFRGEAGEFHRYMQQLLGTAKEFRPAHVLLLGAKASFTDLSAFGAEILGDAAQSILNGINVIAASRTGFWLPPAIIKALGLHYGDTGDWKTTADALTFIKDHRQKWTPLNIAEHPDLPDDEIIVRFRDDIADADRGSSGQNGLLEDSGSTAPGTANSSEPVPVSADKGKKTLKRSPETTGPPVVAGRTPVMPVALQTSGLSKKALSPAVLPQEVSTENSYETMRDKLRRHYSDPSLDLKYKLVVTLFGLESPGNIDAQIARDKDMLKEQAEADIHPVGVGIVPSGTDLSGKGFVPYAEYRALSHSVEGQPDFKIPFKGKYLGGYGFVKEIPLNDKRKALLFYFVEPAEQPYRIKFTMKWMQKIADRVAEGQFLARVTRQLFNDLNHKTSTKLREKTLHELGKADAAFAPEELIMVGANAAFAAHLAAALGSPKERSTFIPAIQRFFAVVPDDYWIPAKVYAKLQFLAGIGKAPFEKASRILYRLADEQKWVAYARNMLPGTVVSRDMLKAFDEKFVDRNIYNVFSTLDDTAIGELWDEADAGARPVGIVLDHLTAQDKDSDSYAAEHGWQRLLDGEVEIRFKDEPVKLNVYYETLTDPEDENKKITILHIVDDPRVILRNGNPMDTTVADNVLMWNEAIDLMILSLSAHRLISTLQDQTLGKDGRTLLGLSEAGTALIKLIGRKAALTSNDYYGGSRAKFASTTFDEAVLVATSDEELVIPESVLSALGFPQARQQYLDVREFVARYMNRVTPEDVAAHINKMAAERRDRQARRWDLAAVLPFAAVFAVMLFAHFYAPFSASLAQVFAQLPAGFPMFGAMGTGTASLAVTKLDKRKEEDKKAAAGNAKAQGKTVLLEENIGLAGKLVVNAYEGINEAARTEMDRQVELGIHTIGAAFLDRSTGVKTDRLMKLASITVNYQGKDVQLKVLMEKTPKLKRTPLVLYFEGKREFSDDAAGLLIDAAVQKLVNEIEHGNTIQKIVASQLKLLMPAETPAPWFKVAKIKASGSPALFTDVAEKAVDLNEKVPEEKTSVGRREMTPRQKALASLRHLDQDLVGKLSLIVTDKVDDELKKNLREQAEKGVLVVGMALYKDRDRNKDRTSAAPKKLPFKITVDLRGEKVELDVYAETIPAGDRNALMLYFGDDAVSGPDSMEEFVNDAQTLGLAVHEGLKLLAAASTNSISSEATIDIYRRMNIMPIRFIPEKITLLGGKTFFIHKLDRVSGKKEINRDKRYMGSLIAGLDEDVLIPRKIAEDYQIKDAGGTDGLNVRDLVDDIDDAFLPVEKEKTQATGGSGKPSSKPALDAASGTDLPSEKPSGEMREETASKGTTVSQRKTLYGYTREKIAELYDRLLTGRVSISLYDMDDPLARKELLAQTRKKIRPIGISMIRISTDQLPKGTVIDEDGKYLDEFVKMKNRENSGSVWKRLSSVESHRQKGKTDQLLIMVRLRGKMVKMPVLSEEITGEDGARALFLHVVDTTRNIERADNPLDMNMDPDQAINALSPAGKKTLWDKTVNALVFSIAARNVIVQVIMHRKWRGNEYIYNRYISRFLGIDNEDGRLPLVRIMGYMGAHFADLSTAGERHDAVHLTNSLAPEMPVVGVTDDYPPVFIPVSIRKALSIREYGEIELGDFVYRRANGKLSLEDKVKRDAVLLNLSPSQYSPRNSSSKKRMKEDNDKNTIGEGNAVIDAIGTLFTFPAVVRKAVVRQMKKAPEEFLEKNAPDFVNALSVNLWDATEAADLAAGKTSDGRERLKAALKAQAELGMRPVAFSLLKGDKETMLELEQLKPVYRFPLNYRGEFHTIGVFTEELTGKNGEPAPIIYLADINNTIPYATLADEESTAALHWAVDGQVFALAVNEALRRMYDNEVFGRIISEQLKIPSRKKDLVPKIVHLYGDQPVFAASLRETAGFAGPSVFDSAVLVAHEAGERALPDSVIDTLGIHSNSDRGFSTAELSARFVDVFLPAGENGEALRALLSLPDGKLLNKRLDDTPLNREKLAVLLSILPSRRKRLIGTETGIKPGVLFSSTVKELNSAPYTEAQRGTLADLKAYLDQLAAMGPVTALLTDVLDPTTPVAADGTPRFNETVIGRRRMKQRGEEWDRQTIAREKILNALMENGRIRRDIDVLFSYPAGTKVIDPVMIRKMTDMGFAGVRIDLEKATKAYLPDTELLLEIGRQTPGAIVQFISPSDGNLKEIFEQRLKDSGLEATIVRPYRLGTDPDALLNDGENVNLQVFAKPEDMEGDAWTLKLMEEKLQKAVNSRARYVEFPRAVLDGIVPDLGAEPVRAAAPGHTIFAQLGIEKMLRGLIDLRMNDPQNIALRQGKAYRSAAAAVRSLTTRTEQLQTVLDDLRTVRSLELPDGHTVVSHGLNLFTEVNAYLQDGQSSSMDNQALTEALFGAFRDVFQKSQSLKESAWGQALAEAVNDIERRNEPAAASRIFLAYMQGYMEELLAKAYPRDAEFEDADYEAAWKKLYLAVDSRLVKEDGQNRVLNDTADWGKELFMNMKMVEQLDAMGRSDFAEALLKDAAAAINGGKVKDGLSSLMFVEAVYRHLAGRDTVYGKQLPEAIVHRYFVNAENREFLLKKGGDKRTVLDAVIKTVDGYQTTASYGVGEKGFYRNAAKIQLELLDSYANGEDRARRKAETVLARTAGGISSRPPDASGADDRVRNSLYALLTLSHNNDLAFNLSQSKMAEPSTASTDPAVTMFRPYYVRNSLERIRGNDFTATVTAAEIKKILLPLAGQRSLPSARRDPVIASGVLELLLAYADKKTHMEVEKAVTLSIEATRAVLAAS